MNTTLQTTTSQSPIIPTINPQLPLTPSNLLAWILLLTALLSAIDEPIKATTNLLKSLNDLIKTLRRPR